MSHGTTKFLVLVMFIHSGANCSAAKAEQQTAEVLRIDSLCNEVDGFAKDHKDNAILVANIASNDDTAAQWVYFESDSLRNDLDSGDNLNENAFVYLREGNTVFAMFTFQSSSRDWAQYVGYYYRDDGTLALAHSQLRTFYGDVNIDRTYWLGRSGTVLDSAFSIKDLGSGRALREEREYQDEPVRFFLKTSDLPFEPLLDSLAETMR